MSNERIDLTQFEGMTGGPWHFCLPYNAETDTYEGDAQMKGGGDRVNGPVVLSQYQFARGTANQRADLRAMESCPELIAELKRMYKREEELMDILTILEDRQGVEIPCSHNWITEDEHYTYRGEEWILRNVHCEYCLEDNDDLNFDQTVEDFQKASE